MSLLILFVPDDYTCPSCTLVQRDAHQVTCCGQIYCKSCLEQLKKKANNFGCSPNCCSSLAGDHMFFPDKNSVTKINHLRIHCINKERGCKWVGHLKDLDTVHRPKCPHEIVECTNKKQSSEPCGAKIQRRDLTVHKTRHCQWRKVKCPHCNKEGRHNEITGCHLEECPDLELPCGNNGCPVKIKRCLMTEHYDECPKQIMACRYRFAGCEEKFTRESTQDHNKEFIQHHLDKAINNTETTQRQLNETTERLNKTTERLNEATASIDDLQSNSRVSKIVKIPIVHGNDSIGSGFYLPKSKMFAKPGKHHLVLKVNTERIPRYRLYMTIMPGLYDDELEWPVEGTVTVQIQNQEEDRNHRLVVDNKQVAFDNKIVVPAVCGEWKPLCEFTIEQADKYMKNNNLFFNVTGTLTCEFKHWLH